MSKRNGDKARFGREQYRKVVRRERARALKLALESKAARAARAGSK